MEPLVTAIKLIGLQPLASGCGVTYQALRKWQRQGLPRSEWSGETTYAETIERMTEGRITKAALLEASRKLRAGLRKPASIPADRVGAA